GDAARVINNLKSEQQVFDLVFLDPPYAKQQIVSQIEALLDNNMLSPEALIVCEVDKKVDLPETIKQAQVYKSAEYGITKIMIYELVSQEEGENE
ncbi:MAG: RsmD family RNA methyltransferase, partial [Desemzia incerta]